MNELSSSLESAFHAAFRISVVITLFNGCVTAAKTLTKWFRTLRSRHDFDSKKR